MGFGTGKIAGSGHPFCPFYCMRTGDKEQPIHRTFFIMPALLLLSIHSRDGIREFSWVSPPLSLVLTNTSWDGEHGTALTEDFVILT
jgi:hypothetical protein